MITMMVASATKAVEREKTTSTVFSPTDAKTQAAAQKQLSKDQAVSSSIEEQGLPIPKTLCMILAILLVIALVIIAFL